MSRSAANFAGQRSRSMPLFIVAHMAAVLLIHGTALAVGGGSASPPFPLDLPIESRRPSLPWPSTAVPGQVVPEVKQEAVPASGDIAPPWTFDVEGRTQFTTR